MCSTACGFHILQLQRLRSADPTTHSGDNSTPSRRRSSHDTRVGRQVVLSDSLTEEIKNILRELLRPSGELTIVTDALDECHDSVRSGVLSWIANLQAIVPVRYLATTRDYYSNTFHSIFQDQPALEVKASKHDLELYTSFRAMTLRAKVQPDLLEELIEGVVTAADGM
jgi:hypothetical protein